MLTFDIKKHRHLFAAWAAGRAASVVDQRFSVQRARSAIELSGVMDFGADLPSPISAAEFDRLHREWRNSIANALNVQHGVAAKLINVYLKALFLGDAGERPSLLDIAHPPLDFLLLDALDKATRRRSPTTHEREWPLRRSGSRWSAVRWSKLGPDQYEALIADLREAAGDRPFWRVEEYWSGAQ